ncbi:unnamed protein product [Trifolium pratense]|uniref:Uncharacterized protein n=1 Tax=Trifolium pratense TaxID=57577 RepID=A0ACB0I6I9_TRIPR|nr:unnamed protein product [Trifolium pratense]
MKNMISPIQSVVPSPTFLWRFKVTLFLIWALAVRSNFVSSLNSIYDCLRTSEHLLRNFLNIYLFQAKN